MNTNNPDYVKHAKAALASKAEMDKWKRIEIYDAIAAISFLAIAWFVSSWLVAIAGIVICGAVGAYATSKKEKAKQDTLDHINRSEGMSESLVQASRGRRGAENALASAIKKLDEASSKLRSATTYDEKKKAEAEVVSAQAAIEGAKLRLQQATTRESIETQKSQQQASSVVKATNQASQNKDSFEFSGEKDLSIDGYRIYLVKKYSIEKNEALGKFVCGERLFDDIEGALSHADSLDDAHGVSLETEELDGIPEVPVIPELQVDMQDLRSAQRGSSSFTPEANFQKNNTNKILIAGLVIAVCVGALYFIFGKNGGEVKQGDATQNKTNVAISKTYSEHRNDILASGWQPYVRPNEFKDWSREFPELQFCYEDGCQASFIKPSDPTKIRDVYFIICSADRYYQCPGKPNGFYRVESDSVIDKNTADEDFRKTKEQFGN